jgi:enamine deaminase RidA (YjgF/YER057c/UK114 family)
MPEDPGAQVANVFANMRRILAAAGASTEDVIKVTVFLKDSSLREIVNQEWVAMFPERESRPARHTIMSPALAAPQLVQLEIWAIASES